MMNGALSVMIFFILMMPIPSVNNWATLVLLLITLQLQSKDSFSYIVHCMYL